MVGCREASDSVWWDTHLGNKEDTMKLHKDYEKYIKHSRKGALQLIADLTINYDGYVTASKLEELIDEIRAVALLGLKQKD